MAPLVRSIRIGLGVLLLILVHTSAWNLPSTMKPFTLSSPQLSVRMSPTDSSDADDAWSVTDNWTRLSKADGTQQDDSHHHLINADQTTLAALRMQNFGMNPAPPELSKEDQWLNDAIEHIVTENVDEVDATLLAKSSSSSSDASVHSESFSDDMGREIALLVRCNENPHQLLLDGGRLVEELTDKQRNDVGQLVEFNGDDATWKATGFLREAVISMFQTHAVNKRVNGVDRAAAAAVLDAASLASWMSQSLRDTVGPHDKRVTQTVARYGREGCLSESDLLNLYVTALTVAGDDDAWTATTTLQLEQHRKPEIQAVWRDIRNHGIVTPAEFERSIKVAEIQAQYGVSAEDDIYSRNFNLLDECEILEDHLISEVSMTTDRQGKSSHERVELFRNVPVWMRDGDFVFIDEQSCIGCMQCTTAAPASFQMLEHNGRARTFYQRKSPDVKSAVKACPVDCMHFVSFDELKELELARDVGVGDDHRHFGHTADRGYIAPTPLHVSRRDSDANHRSSFYHFLRSKCFKSTQCPQRGCYDCSRYKDEPGSNPYFQKRLATATHIRAEYFKKTGLADSYRKTASL